MLRVLVDENVDCPVVAFLRRQGYDVTSIAESAPSLSDLSIFRQAWNERRVIITCDKDFGNLAFQKKLPSVGVVLLRLRDQSARAKIRALHLLLERYYLRLSGNFIVVSERKIRIRKL